ncbi:MAG: hypothetical protein ACYS8W_08690 [Planctomycetota bacterium]|jgi:hypothetical protein
MKRFTYLIVLAAALALVAAFPGCSSKKKDTIKTGTAATGTGTGTGGTGITGTGTGSSGTGTGSSGTGTGGGGYPTQVGCSPGAFATGWVENGSKHDGQVFIDPYQNVSTQHFGFIKIDTSGIAADAQVASASLHYHVDSYTGTASLDMTMTFGDPQVADGANIWDNTIHSDIVPFGSSGWKTYSLGWPGKSSFEKLQTAISEGRGYVTFLPYVPC